MPDREVLNELVEAHRRVQAKRPTPLGEPPEHRPVAAVLSCSDARVSPNLVFDQHGGRLFVVRIAGNTAVPAALASLDFAVDALGVELLLVLGHTGCGAVQAAVAGTCGGHLASVVEPICRVAREMPDATVDELVRANVSATMADLADHDGPVGQAFRDGRLTIEGAVHDLSSGGLQLVARSATPHDTTSPDTTSHDHTSHNNTSRETLETT